MVVELRTQLRYTDDRLMTSEGKVEDLTEKLIATKINMEQLQKENSDMQGRLSSSETDLSNNKFKIEQLEKENPERPKVAFYAGLTNVGYVGPFHIDITLKYTKVITNIGNAYNPDTGFFTAPVRGVYYIRFTVCSASVANMGLRISKNNQKIMYNELYNRDGHGEYISNGVVLNLEAGDNIHMSLPSAHVIFDNSDNQITFSGFLLFPM
ncbi:complement C1q-like protein 2 isoform 2-T2 [Polymixia lowei]